MLYHRAINRTRGLKAGSPSAFEQLMNMLELSPELHTKDATVDLESTHLSAAIDNFVLRVRQHNEGAPDEETNCPESLIDRRPRSWGLMHDKGDALFGRDTYHDRYAVGTIRLATATGTSVTASPYSYVPATEDINGCDLNIYFANDDLQFMEGDTVPYVIKMVTDDDGQRSGQAWTFGGSGGGLRVATSTAKWADGSPDPYVNCTDNASGEAIVVRLPRTMPGDPNVRSGAKVVYGRANDGLLYCVTDYMDDKIGTLKPNKITIAEFVPGWEYHADSAGRVHPNFLADDPDYSPLLNEFGEKTHTHDPHELNLQMATATVVSTIDASDPCAIVYCHQQLCFVGSTGAQTC